MANKYSEKVVEGRSFSFRLVIISASVLAIFINPGRSGGTSRRRRRRKEFIEMHDGKNLLSREILASTGFPDKMK
jgi:hypothetical protein